MRTTEVLLCPAQHEEQQARLQDSHEHKRRTSRGPRGRNGVGQGTGISDGGRITCSLTHPSSSVRGSIALPFPYSRKLWAVPSTETVR